MNPVIYPTKAHIEDTDYSGVVYHANYLNYFERARSEWLESLGLDISWQHEQGLYFTIRHIEIDYLKPAKLGDRLEVVTQIAQLKRVSIIFKQCLRLASTPDTILCEAMVVIACVDTSFKPTAIPKYGLHQLQMGEPE